jgi:hypothetical protein
MQLDNYFLQKNRVVKLVDNEMSREAPFKQEISLHFDVDAINFQNECGAVIVPPLRTHQRGCNKLCF